MGTVRVCMVVQRTQAKKAKLVIQIKKVENTVVSKENVVRQRVLHAGFFEELHEQVDRLRESLATIEGLQ
jgi:hypothetical protein